MATEPIVIVSGASQVYAGTEATNSKMVGYSKKNYVVRYAFTTGKEGASSISWELDGNSHDSNPSSAYYTGIKQQLRWFITTSSTSHINAGSTTTKHHGDVTVSSVGNADVFSGSVEMVMLPNTTYYLWIFPATATYGFYWLTVSAKATLTTSGSAGLVRIRDGSAFHAYKCVIYNGSKWESYMPKIYNGSSWDLSG